VWAKISNKIRLVFDGSKANQSKPRVYHVNHPPTSSKNVLQGTKLSKKVGAQHSWK
jgi:hypothetical protein